MKKENFFDVILKVAALAGSIFGSVMMLAACIYQTCDNHWKNRSEFARSEFAKVEMAGGVAPQ